VSKGTGVFAHRSVGGCMDQLDENVTASDGQDNRTPPGWQKFLVRNELTRRQ